MSVLMDLMGIGDANRLGPQAHCDAQFEAIQNRPKKTGQNITSDEILARIQRLSGRSALDSYGGTFAANVASNGDRRALTYNPDELQYSRRIGAVFAKDIGEKRRQQRGLAPCTPH